MQYYIVYNSNTGNIVRKFAFFDSMKKSLQADEHYKKFNVAPL